MPFLDREGLKALIGDVKKYVDNVKATLTININDLTSSITKKENELKAKDSSIETAYKQADEELRGSINTINKNVNNNSASLVSMGDDVNDLQTLTSEMNGDIEECKTKISALETATGTPTTYTAERVLVTNSSGYITASSKVTTAELETLDGIGSTKISTQLSNKASSSHSHALTSDKITGVLPVSKGGTGAESFSTNSILLGNGNNAIQAITPSVGAMYFPRASQQPSFGTLPVSCGGTGAKTPLDARQNLGIIYHSLKIEAAAGAGVIHEDLPGYAPDNITAAFGTIRYIKELGQKEDQTPAYINHIHFSIYPVTGGFTLYMVNDSGKALDLWMDVLVIADV